MMKWSAYLFLFAIACATCTETPVQSVDDDFDARISDPLFVRNGPVILFDEAHNNFHKTSGLYKPFADLVRNDGYSLKTISTLVTPTQLNGVRIYVIANARGSGDMNDNPAFSEQEVEVIRNWVWNGGSLLLIADHFPFGGAVQNLASQFGIHFQKGMVQDSVHFDKNSNDQSQLEFSLKNKLLKSHPITQNVDKVITFTGQSVQCKNSNCISFLELSEWAYDLTPVTKISKDGDDTRVEVNYEQPVSAKGRSQGVAVYFGKGRIVCLGEAAMLTAQITRDGSKVGMNYNPPNKQLARNILRWLSGL